MTNDYTQHNTMLLGSKLASTSLILNCMQINAVRDVFGTVEIYTIYENLFASPKRYHLIILLYKYQKPITYL